MSKLFLTSYLAGTKNLVKEFLKDVPEKEITFVPTASNTEDYKGYVDEAKQAFLKLGFSINILDISKIENSADLIIEGYKNFVCIRWKYILSIARAKT